MSSIYNKPHETFHAAVGVVSKLTQSNGLTEKEANANFEQWAPFVKAVNTYQPYKLKEDQKVSNISSDEIVDRIVDYTVKIEGPVSSVMLTPRQTLNDSLGRQAPVLWLLGDRHFGREHCRVCDTNDLCFSMYNKHTLPMPDKRNVATFLPHLQWLSQLEDGRAIATDFFLEFWPQTKFENVSPSTMAAEGDSLKNPTIDSKSSIFDTLIDAYPCLSKHKEHCSVPKLRVHASDPRYRIEDINVLIKSIIWDTFDTWKIRCNNIFKTNIKGKKGNKMREHTHAACLSIIANRIRLGSHTFVKTFAKDITTNDSPALKYYKTLLLMKSKTIHEIKQLPIKIQESMMEYLCTCNPDDILNRAYPTFFADFITHDDGLIRFSSNTDDLVNIYMEMRIQMIQSLHLSMDIDLFGKGSMDMFFLARALKSPLYGLPSQLSVIYAGDAHIYNIVMYLTTYMPYYEIENISSQRLDDSLNTKCRDIVSLEDENTLILETMNYAILPNTLHPNVSKEYIQLNLCMPIVCHCLNYFTNTNQLTTFAPWLEACKTFVSRLRWQDFYFDPSSCTRILKDENSVLAMIPFVTKQVLNNLQCIGDLVQNQTFVQALVFHKRKFNSVTTKKHLQFILAAEDTDMQVKTNISTVLEHCYVSSTRKQAKAKAVSNLSLHQTL